MKTMDIYEDEKDGREYDHDGCNDYRNWYVGDEYGCEYDKDEYTYDGEWLTDDSRAINERKKSWWCVFKRLCEQGG